MTSEELGLLAGLGLALCAWGLRVSGYQNRALGLAMFWFGIAVMVAASVAWMWPVSFSEVRLQTGAALALAILAASQVDRQVRQTGPSPLAAERELIQEVKTAAGRATDGFVGLNLFHPFPKTTADIEDLRRAYAGLRHYAVLYREARKLEGYLRYLASLQGTARDHMEILDPAEETYKRLIMACDDLLKLPMAHPPTRSGS